MTLESLMKNLSLKVTAWLSVLPTLLLPAAAFAQLSEAQTDLAEVGTAIGTDATNNDLPTLIGNIISALLSVLGIIFVVLVVYAGFLYLTAQGEDTKVKKAKTALQFSVIGFVLMLLSFPIVNAIVNLIYGIG